MYISNFHRFWPFSKTSLKLQKQAHFGRANTSDTAKHCHWSISHTKTKKRNWSLPGTSKKYFSFFWGDQKSTPREFTKCMYISNFHRFWPFSKTSLNCRSKHILGGQIPPTRRNTAIEAYLTQKTKTQNWSLPGSSKKYFSFFLGDQKSTPREFTKCMYISNFHRFWPFSKTSLNCRSKHILGGQIPPTRRNTAIEAHLKQKRKNEIGLYQEHQKNIFHFF